MANVNPPAPASAAPSGRHETDETFDPSYEQAFDGGRLEINRAAPPPTERKCSCCRATAVHHPSDDRCDRALPLGVLLAHTSRSLAVEDSHLVFVVASAGDGGRRNGVLDASNLVARKCDLQRAQ